MNFKEIKKTEDLFNWSKELNDIYQESDQNKEEFLKLFFPYQEANFGHYSGDEEFLNEYEKNNAALIHEKMTKDEIMFDDFSFGFVFQFFQMNDYAEMFFDGEVTLDDINQKLKDDLEIKDELDFVKAYVKFFKNAKK